MTTLIDGATTDTIPPGSILTVDATAGAALIQDIDGSDEWNATAETVQLGEYRQQRRVRVIWISGTVSYTITELTDPIDGSLTGDGAPVDFVGGVKASKAYASAGSNNDLTVTAEIAGSAGNAMAVSCVQSTAKPGALSVAFANNAILITLPSDGNGDPVVKTATQVKAAWDAVALVKMNATVAVEGTGAGTVAAFSSAPLENGADPVGTGRNYSPIGSSYTDYTNAKKYINGGTKAEPVWKIITSA